MLKFFLITLCLYFVYTSTTQNNPRLYKVFNFTQRSANGKYTPLSVDELKQNVLTLIKDCFAGDNSGEAE